MSRNTEPADLVSRQCRALLKGSVLELLVAVPTHVVARYRDYCCAGFLTFIGLTMGVSVMLFAYGPAVFFPLCRALEPVASGPEKSDCGHRKILRRTAKIPLEYKTKLMVNHFMKTRILKLVVSGAALSMLAGCIVLSVYPFYNTKDLIFDPNLAGRWAKADTTNEFWQFTASGEKSYTLTTVDASSTNCFDAAFVPAQSNTNFWICSQPTARSSCCHCI